MTVSARTQDSSAHLGAPIDVQTSTSDERIVQRRAAYTSHTVSHPATSHAVVWVPRQARERACFEVHDFLRAVRAILNSQKRLRQGRKRPGRVEGKLGGVVKPSAVTLEGRIELVQKWIEDNAYCWLFLVDEADRD